MQTLVKKLDISNILKGLGILIVLCLLGGAIGIWQAPTPPPPLPETHATPLTPEEVALFQQWAAWTNHQMKLFSTIGLTMVLLLGYCVIAGVASRGVLLGGILVLLVLGSSFYLVNHYVQTEVVRMTQKAQQGG